MMPEDKPTDAGLEKVEIPAAEADPKPEVTKMPEPTGQPQGDVTPPEGESLEDLKKQKAYFQTKSQELAAQNKVFQDGLGETSVAPNLGAPVMAPQSVPEQKPEETSAAPEDEFDQGAQMAAMENRIVGRIEQRDRQREEKVIYDQWQAEAQRAEADMAKFVGENKIPDDVARVAFRKAHEMGPGWNTVGGPQRTAKLAGEFITAELTQRHINQTVEERQAEATLKEQQAAHVAQPASSGVPTPQATTPEQQAMADEADDIAPDDSDFD